FSDLVDALQVELDVDKTSALALQLVRHATGAEDHYTQILWIGLDGLTQCTTEVQTALGRGYRMLHGVDRQRNGFYRPFFVGAVERKDRVYEAVVDQHFLTHAHVEFLLHQRLCQMPGELRVAIKGRYGLQAPAFISVVVGICT